MAGGTLRLDLHLELERTTPPSPVVRVGPALTTLTRLDANFNPRDARIDENRYQAVLGYTRATSLGTWDSTVSAAFSEITDIRGFLRPSLIDDGSQNADSQRQARRIEDFYADSHLHRAFGAGLSLLYGADVLYGLGKQSSQNGAYYAPLSGAGPLPASIALHVDEVNSLSDRRLFAGQYAQADWQAGPALDLFAGIRANETAERKRSGHVDGFDPSADLAAAASRRTLRPSGVVGASVTILHQKAHRVVAYLDARDAFKPAAIDFGPDYTPAVLRPALRCLPVAAWAALIFLMGVSFSATADAPCATAWPSGVPADLTPQQQQRLSVLEAASRGQADRLLDQIRQLRGKLFDLYGGYTLDATEAARLDKNLNHVQEQLLDLRLSEQQQLRAILSPEQFAGIQAAIRAHGDRDHDGDRPSPFPGLAH